MCLIDVYFYIHTVRRKGHFGEVVLLFAGGEFISWIGN